MDCDLALSEVDIHHIPSINTLKNVVTQCKIYLTQGEHPIHHIPSINNLKNVATQDLFHSRWAHNQSYP
jgi:hypothetical protein